MTYTKDGEAGPMLQSTRKHDAANRLTRITAHVNDAGVQKPIDHHAYDYDALDHIQKHTGITGAFWKYGYNATGEVTGATQKMPDATTDYFGRNYRYHYDGIGNRTSVEQSRNGAQASRLFFYTPDALNQYSAITHPGFVDVSGTASPLAAVTVNGIAAARQSDYFYKELSDDNSAGPQWIEATITDGTTTNNGSLSLPAIAASPVYDDDGNLTSDGEWIHTWDAENRLIGIERSAAAIAAGAPYHREKHDYDHRGRRIRTTIFPNNGTTPSSQTLYIFDGWKCVAELNGNGQPIRKYTWGLDLANRLDDASTGNVGALLWLVDCASSKTHIHLYDKNGNVTGLVDPTTRKRSATYEYDAFGQLITCYGEYAKSNPFTFSTKFTDFVTGLRYYGYRWYGAKDGRWLSRDPIEEQGGVNLYGFVGNDGINSLDYLGLSTLTVRVNRYARTQVAMHSIVNISTDDSNVNRCCKLPREYHGVENVTSLEPGRVGARKIPHNSHEGNPGGYNLLNPDMNWISDFGRENSVPFGKNNPSGAGLTSIVGRVAKHGDRGIVIPSRPEDMNTEDYNDAIKNEFFTKDGGVNIHSGANQNHSTGCVVLGTCVSPSNEGKFMLTSYQDSLLADLQFKASVACAERLSPGIRLVTRVSGIPLLQNPSPRNPISPRPITVYQR